MSDSPTAAGEMSRAELEECVEDLRSQIEALESTIEDVRSSSGKDRASIHKRLSGLEEELDDLETAVASHGETLDTIADIGDDKTSQEEKLGAIIAYANQARDNSSKVLITPKEIAGATGCSKRYAYDLVDEIGGLREDGSGGGYDEGEYPWAAVRKAQTVPTANGGERKSKGLKIDFDRVQRDPDALNWFNNGSGGNGSE